MKILNLFAGIGGNRTLWGDKHEIIAIDNNQQIAMIYLKRFPNDKVIIEDAYKYNLDHYKEFDVIWASPPCQTHTRMVSFPRFKKKYPDLRLYELILFLGSFFNGYYIIENVVPHYSLESVDRFYKPFIVPSAIVDRHYIWTNFQLNNKKFDKPRGNFKDLSKEVLCDYLQVDLELIIAAKLKNKRNHDPIRQALRNCVLPEAGKYILDSINTITLDKFTKEIIREN